MIDPKLVEALIALYEKRYADNQEEILLQLRTLLSAESKPEADPYSEGDFVRVNASARPTSLIGQIGKVIYLDYPAMVEILTAEGRIITCSGEECDFVPEFTNNEAVIVFDEDGTPRVTFNGKEEVYTPIFELVMALYYNHTELPFSITVTKITEKRASDELSADT